MITLRAKKRKAPAERDTVTILRDAARAGADAPAWVFQAWNQGILPHELVHFAVEEALGLRGFVREIAAGRTSEDILESLEVEVVQTEALTNALQYELLGLAEVSNAEVRRAANEQCDRHGVPRIELTGRELEATRARLRELNERWAGLAPGEVLELTLAPEARA